MITKQVLRKKALVTAIKKGYWTPTKVSLEIMNKVQAEVNLLLQMQCELAKDMKHVESLILLMGNEMPMHPSSDEIDELKLKIGYLHAIIAVMLKVPTLKSFDNAIDFLHYLRGEAWNRGMFEAGTKESTIFDIVDMCGVIMRHPTAGKASFYTPPCELLDAAKVFLRVRQYKASPEIGSQRVVKIDEQTSIINIDAADRTKEVLGVPNQCITVLGATTDLPQWAIMVQKGQTLGLYHHAAEPHAFVIYNGNSAQDACKYQAY